LKVDIQGDQFSDAPLLAAYADHEHICKLLLDAGAELNSLLDGSFKALQAAAYRGRERLCKSLLDAGANLNMRYLQE
jgi:ankyrin repeat protein